MYAVLVAFWALGFWVLWRIPRLGPAPPAGAPLGSVSVIIPARNEERPLARLLDSLAAQKHPPLEIMVVDDHSDDGTADIALAHCAHVIRSAQLPPGWLGKTWACWQGAQAATGEILVFLDADTWLQPDALARIAGEHGRSGGLLSVQPYHRMERLGERLAAFFNIVTMAGTGAFGPAAARTRARGAFGPCLVSRRDDYFATGGHRLARGQVLESIEMARAFRAAGHPVALYGGRGALSFRMYPDGLGAMIDGFSKGFAGGAAALSLPMLVMLVAWITGGASCTRHLIQAALGSGAEALPFWAGLYAAFCAQIHWMLRRIGNFGLLPCLLFPVPLAFFALVFLRSLLLRAGLAKVSWKGRRVS